MRAKKALVPLVLLGALAGWISAAPAAERMALVIGNGRYAHAPYLNNPGRDARAVAEAGRYTVEIGGVDRLEIEVSPAAFREAVTAMEAVRDAVE